MHRSTSGVRRACAVGTAITLIGLTTGFGALSATAAYAVDAPTTTTSSGTTSTSDGTAPIEVTAPTDTTTSDTAPTSTDPTGTAPTDAATTPTAEPTAPATDAPTAPASGTPTTEAVQDPAVEIAAAPAVTISGQAKIGSKLTAESDGGVKYAWSIDGTVVETRNVYTPTDTALIGEVVTLTITDVITGETNSAESAPIQPNLVFTDSTTADEPLELSSTAGEAFSHTFAATGAGAGVVAYSVTWSDPDSADPEDPTYTPDTQLPDGITLDGATGVLSGTSENASYYDFAITATSQGSTATQYVELTVDAAAPVGVQVFSMDKSDFDTYITGDASGTYTSWIVDADGSVSTDVETISQTGNGIDFEDTVTPGGTVTVQQGGTLFVNGGLVDRFGNQIFDEDYNTAPIAITSDTASDVIVRDPDIGTFVDGYYDVTFPQAATHRLTVTSEGFATSFAVQVTPTAVAPVVDAPPTIAPVAVTPVRHQTTARGHLAYTGADDSGTIAWALGLLAAGVGVTGLRIARRRTQR